MGLKLGDRKSVENLEAGWFTQNPMELSNRLFNRTHTKPDVILPSGAILSDKADEFWEEMEFLSNQVKESVSNTFPLPDGIFEQGK